MNKSTIKTIATHNGQFHLDELVAIAIMKLIDDNIMVVRTRKPETYNACDMRVDVGEEYNLELNTYDHHQREEIPPRENGVPYASAGLVWKHFGRSLCSSDDVHARIDKELIQPVDIIDSGKDISDGKAFMRSFSMHREIGNLNRIVGLGKESEVSAFNRSIVQVIGMLENELLVANEQANVDEHIREILSRYKGKPYVVLDEGMLWWQNVIVSETDKTYVIFLGSDGRYKVQGVPPAIGEFSCRKPFPKEWRGHTNELSKISNVEGALFCHKNGFLSSTNSLDSAIKMAEKAYAATE